jgi:short-subunit dehydrogenase
MRTSARITGASGGIGQRLRAIRQRGTLLPRTIG